MNTNGHFANCGNHTPSVGLRRESAFLIYNMLYVG